MMNGKEKLKCAFEHKEAPILFDIGAYPTTGIHCSVVEKLREYYGLEKRLVKIIEPMQMLGFVEDDLKDALGIQTSPIWNNYNLFGVKNESFKEFKTDFGQTVLVPKDFNTKVDDKGDTLVFPQGNMTAKPSGRMPKGGFFFDAIIRNDDFDEDNFNYLDNCEEFKVVGDDTLEYYKDAIKNLNKDDAIVGNLGGTAIGDIALIPGMSLLKPKGIRDIEEWYVSTLMRQEEINEIFSYEVEIAIKSLEKTYQVIGDEIQVAYICGNDLGTQRSPFCSSEVFEKIYAPHYRKINNWIHSNTNWKTFKHSCGSIKPLIKNLIECGFDVLNPVQWSAENMDREELKREFGNEITFWGGGINTQKTLPFGTPKEVYEEALSCLKTFSAGGGYVFNAIHNIQAKTPVENVVALESAVKDFNGEK